ncbi:hypothetical protein [Microbulbifer sp.]|uniref:hypothetical protein n=1 Tax=Microbulbifer sp. TaxID=1908541 RepID=UPI0025856CE4|nr:hypothetical protein [Microbulbifer sp.]
MKKLFPLIALLLVAAIAALYGLDHYQKLRADQRAQVSYLLSRCANEGLLSLFSLQANDWKKNPELLKQEEARLLRAAGALPEKTLEGKVFGDWQAAVQVCERLTENSVRQHKTIFWPVKELAESELWNPGDLNDRRRLHRRQRDIDRARISAQAADRYLIDLRADLNNLLDQSGIDKETLPEINAELDRQVFSGYHKGAFSLAWVQQYLNRLQHFYQLLKENPKGFTLRGGSLYFYDQSLRREVDDLNRVLLQGEPAFFNNWRQILRR